jgi:hypothetical protein
MADVTEERCKLNARQERALKLYAASGEVRYPMDLDVRASTARSLCTRGLLKQVVDHSRIYFYDWADWAKYVITDVGRERAK